ncbi:MAG: hypothetical protein ABW346_00270 [Terrimicrobium sp.]
MNMVWVLDTGVPRIAADGAFLGYMSASHPVIASVDDEGLHTHFGTRAVE